MTKVGISSGLLISVLVLLGLRARQQTEPPTEHTTVIEGSARSHDGEPISGARICASDVGVRALGGMRVRCASTTATGSYVITGLEAGSYDVSAVADGFLPANAWRARGVVLRAGRAPDKVDFILERGGVLLRGLVQDATGAPVPAAKVEIGFGELAQRSTSVETKGDGSFAVWLTPGRLFVRASAEAHATAHTFHVAPSDDLVLRLMPGASISGVVVAARTGLPVANVEVRAVCANCFNSAAAPAAVSGAAGKFTIAGLELGSYALHALGEGYRGGGQARSELGSVQDSRDVTLIVEQLPSLNGSVMLESGGACTRGVVGLGPLAEPSPFGPPMRAADAPEVRANASPPVPSLIASIDELGRVHFPAVPRGTYLAVVRCTDHVWAEGPLQIEVAQVPIEGITWKVKPGLKLITHVVDEAGRPLPGAQYFCSWPDRVNPAVRNRIMYKTDATGRHETERYLYPGSYLLEPYNGHGGEPVTIELADHGGPVEATLRLTGRGSIEVRVQEQSGGSVDAVHVSASRVQSVGEPDVTGARGPLEALPRGDGQFVLGPLAPGAYDVKVDDGLNPPDVRTLQVTTGVAHWAVALDRGSEIRGQVLDAAGNALPGVLVNGDCSAGPQANSQPQRETLAVRSLRRGHRLMTDLQGRFSLRGIARAASACVVRAEHAASVAYAEGVVPGRDITISMREFGALSGSAGAAK